MSKRSDYPRRDRDYYPTPLEAAEPLIPHLPLSFNYVEPCAGDGRLVNHLEDLTDGQANCVSCYDIEPQVDWVDKSDCFNHSWPGYVDGTFCITNPPWERKFLHDFIGHHVQFARTWVLFDANWMFTKQAIPYLTFCEKIISVGRVKWIEGSKHTAKDDCAWYLFNAFKGDKPTEFYGRMF